MIISLADAQEVDQKITQDDLDAFEAAIRQLTNNNFQNTRIRYTGLTFEEPATIKLGAKAFGLRVGDTVQVSDSTYNDGLFTIKAVTDNAIEVNDVEFFGLISKKAFITKVEYPADVRKGVRAMIAYDKKMARNIGTKSETISRMSVTYYDVTSAESVSGYPATVMSFIDKYNKMRWG